MSVITSMRNSLPKFNFTRKKSESFAEESNIHGMKNQYTDQMSSTNIKYEEKEISLTNQRRQRFSNENIKLIQDEKNQRGKSNLHENIKMKVEDYMNNKLSDMNKQNNQHLSFINHKSSILNEIEDVKDILNMKSQMTLYMQSLNNPKYSSKGLLNSNFLIKHNNNSSKRQITSSSVNTQTEKSQENFTALLDWEQTPQKYSQRYLLSQDKMDSVKYTSQRESNNSPLFKRKKVQSLHLSPRDQSKINTPNNINNSLLSNRSEKNIKQPNFQINQSPKSPKRIKLTDLNLNIVKVRLDRNGLPLILEDSALQSGVDQTLNMSSVKTSKNTSFSFSQNDKWQKKFLKGTHKIKEHLNHQSSLLINLNVNNITGNNNVSAKMSSNNKSYINLHSNNNQNLNNMNIDINNIIQSINSNSNKNTINKNSRVNSEDLIKRLNLKNFKFHQDINFSPKLLKLPKLKSYSLPRVDTEKYKKVRQQMFKNA